MMRTRTDRRRERTRQPKAPRIAERRRRGPATITLKAIRRQGTRFRAWFLQPRSKWQWTLEVGLSAALWIGALYFVPVATYDLPSGGNCDGSLRLAAVRGEGELTFARSDACRASLYILGDLSSHNLGSHKP